MWWLRSAFCAHEWHNIGVTKVFLMDAGGKQIGQLPIRQVVNKECSKCGWLWRQNA